MNKIKTYLHNLYYIYRLWSNKRKYPKNVRWKVIISKHLLNNKCYILNDGSVFSISKDGDIQGLCRNRGKRTKSGKEVLLSCLKCGGKKCTGIGEYSYRFYTSNGFYPVCWTQFNWRYAPKDATHSEPLIFYCYTNSSFKRISYEEFLTNTPEKNYVEAYKKRDIYLKNKLKKDQEYF